jgi:hypothetical protein
LLQVFRIFLAAVLGAFSGLADGFKLIQKRYQAAVAFSDFLMPPGMVAVFFFNISAYKVTII